MRIKPSLMGKMGFGRERDNFRGRDRLAHAHLTAGEVLAAGEARNDGGGPRTQPEGEPISLPTGIPP